jgi:hypothetical protein
MSMYPSSHHADSPGKDTKVQLNTTEFAHHILTYDIWMRHIFQQLQVQLLNLSVTRNTTKHLVFYTMWRFLHFICMN